MVMGKHLSFSFFTIFCTLLISIGFTLSNYVHIPIGNSKDVLLNIVHFGIVSLGTFALCYLLSINKFLFSIVFPLLVFVCSVIAYFNFFQNLTFTTSVLDAALHNDMRTSLDLVSFPCVLFVMISLLLAYIAVYYRFKYVAFKFKIIETIFVCISAFVALYINNVQNFTVEQRLPFSIYHVEAMYLSQLQRCDLPRQKIGVDAKSSNDSIVIVLVIGESCRADHLQLNKYKRNTNPELSKLNVISYSNIFSEWTHTNLSLPHFLTRSDSVNHKPATKELSFISIFNLCNYHTYWLANQEPAHTYMPFVKEAQSLIYVNPANSVYNFNKKWLDTDIINPMDKVLTSPTPKKFLILHTIGSHWWYNDHFTDKYALFKPILNTKAISSSNKEAMINSYDNTLVYTDLFLSQVISKLRKLNACMIYLSDHGESLGENGNWLHAQDNEPEKNPACIIWFSKKYKSRNSNVVSNVEKNKDKKWRTEFLFSSILSISDIQTKYKNDNLDITKVIVK